MHRSFDARPFYGQHYERVQRGRETGRAGHVGIRGTGWFLSPQLIVTAAHVADAMHLSTQDWKEIEVRERESTWLVPTRIARVAGSLAEKMVVLELESAIPECRRPSDQDRAARSGGAGGQPRLSEQSPSLRTRSVR